MNERCIVPRLRVLCDDHKCGLLPLSSTRFLVLRSLAELIKTDGDPHFLVSWVSLRVLLPSTQAFAELSQPKILDSALWLKR